MSERDYLQSFNDFLNIRNKYIGDMRDDRHALSTDWQVVLGYRQGEKFDDEDGYRHCTCNPCCYCGLLHQGYES